jgi:RNA polymerase sigma-70 factor, ECF subfamily
MMLFLSLTATRTPVPPDPASWEEDAQLAASAVRGDAAAQRRIASRLLPKIRRIIAATVHNADLADDLTQDTLLKLLESLKDYRAESSLDYWASRIAVRNAMRSIRTRYRRSQLLFFLPEPTSPFERTDAAATIGNLRWHLLRLLSRLPEKQQMALVLHHVNEFSIAETAQIIDVPENTVRDRLRVGKKKLREMLDRNPEIAGWIREGQP